MNPYQILKVAPGVTLKEQGGMACTAQMFHPDKLGRAHATEREA